MEVMSVLLKIFDSVLFVLLGERVSGGDEWGEKRRCCLNDREEWV